MHPRPPPMGGSDQPRRPMEPGGPRRRRSRPARVPGGALSRRPRRRWPPRPWVSCRRQPRRGRSAQRERTTVSAAVAGGAPAIRRNSVASVGPRKGASASPRPSSSATMAGSTPDASGAPSASSARNSRQPEATMAASSFSQRSRSSSSPTARGPSRSTTAVTDSRSASCTDESRTSIRRPSPGPADEASTRRGAYGGAPCPTAAAGSPPRRRPIAVACRSRASRPRTL